MSEKSATTNQNNDHETSTKHNSKTTTTTTTKKKTKQNKSLFNRNYLFYLFPLAFAIFLWYYLNNELFNRFKNGERIVVLFLFKFIIP
jgi:hypothetical protein